MAIEEMLGNPDHVCRNPGCGEQMPLPVNWGKECPHCHYRQPTLDELKRRLPEVFPEVPPRVSALA